MADLHSSTPKIARFAFCAQVAAEASVLLCNCYVTGVSSFGRAQVLLLEANIDQAKKAGAAQAVEVMTMLKDKAGKSPRTIQPEWASCLLPICGAGAGRHVGCGTGRSPSCFLERAVITPA